jgi:hypothetical protein
MTRRRKFILQCSNQSHPKKQRRRTQKCLRRRQRRIKMQSRSSSATTQIGTSALHMLQISNVQSLEFIQRSELTRQHAFAMPRDQQLIVFFREYNKNRMFPSVKHELNNSDDEDYYSSYV